MCVGGASTERAHNKKKVQVSARIAPMLSVVVRECFLF